MSRRYSDPEPTSCCSTDRDADADTDELKLYQAFIFSVPIFFTLILLLLFYLFYLRRQRVDWSSLRMRTSFQINNELPRTRCELGLKKELREMLPIIVFRESFSVRDTQCSVCLGEYQAEDRLQQIPGCGHTFHIDCIDHWLSTCTTCPLCRLSLIPPPPPPKASSTELPDAQAETTSVTHSDAENSNETSLQIGPESCEDQQICQQLSEPTNRDERT